MTKPFAILLLALLPHLCIASIPDDYAPVVVEALFAWSERVFDLSAAVARARSEKKNLFIYVGAHDCPPCRTFSEFLRTHEAELKPTFDKLVVVDIRTWLKGSSSTTFIFKVGDTRYTFDEWRAHVGDQNGSFLTYPYFWLLTPELAQVRQLSRNPARYTDIERLKRMLEPL